MGSCGVVDEGEAMISLPENLRRVVDLAPDEEVYALWPASESDREDGPRGGYRSDEAVNPAGGYLVLSNYRLRFYEYDTSADSPIPRFQRTPGLVIPLATVYEVGIVEESSIAGAPFVIRVTTDVAPAGPRGGDQNPTGGTDYDIEIQSHQDPDGLVRQIFLAARAARGEMAEEETSGMPEPPPDEEGGSRQDGVVHFHAEEDQEP